MRALALVLILALVGVPQTLAQRGSVAQAKLEELRQKKRDLANRHRAAILIANETNVAGVEIRIFEEAAILFSSKGHEIVNQPDSAAVVAGHAKGTPWTAEELAQIADRLQVETVAVGVLKDYRAKRDVGLPLPTMYMRTEARVTIEGLVYQRSRNQIVWTDTVSRKERTYVGGATVSRNRARGRASMNTVDQLFGRYLDKKS